MTSPTDRDFFEGGPKANVDPAAAQANRLAQAERKRKNREFERNLHKTMGELWKRRHQSTIKSLCESGDEDEARDILNDIQASTKADCHGWYEERQ